MSAIQGGIIAAGLSERFRRQGIDTPKAMLPVMGRPLIEHALSEFVRAGVANVTLIFNEESGPLVAPFIREQFPHLTLDILMKNTASSFESFLEVTRRLGPGPALITTVDSIYAPGRLGELIRARKNFPAEALVLGVTRFIDDEKPLYAQLGEASRILSLGPEKSGFATSGVYLIPQKPESASGFKALRYYLMDRVARGEPTYGFDMGKSVDVDHPGDIATAEAFLSTFRAGPASP